MEILLVWSPLYNNTAYSRCQFLGVLSTKMYSIKLPCELLWEWRCFFKVVKQPSSNTPHIPTLLLPDSPSRSHERPIKLKLRSPGCSSSPSPHKPASPLTFPISVNSNSTGPVTQAEAPGSPLRLFLWGFTPYLSSSKPCWQFLQNISRIQHHLALILAQSLAWNFEIVS